MVAFAVFLICVLIGVPVGIWAVEDERRTRFMQVMCDTFQTFPSFIYLIPVIMLFQVGDVAAITAIVIYASIPTIRYTMFGLRSVPSETIEAAITRLHAPAGAVEGPAAAGLPGNHAGGINQTIMFALFMVIIAAFIGTKDLGQERHRTGLA